ncbi:MAG: radical SAM protein [Thermoplasmata archaeon]|nr:MAG: radical SAM protein [Thermoplasmata archaeon]
MKGESQGFLKGIFSPKPLIAPGIHKFDGQGEFSGHRFHLRVDDSGSGVLIMDASKMIYLNGTAVEHAKYCIENRSSEEMVREFKKRYRKADKDKLESDHKIIRKKLLGLTKGKHEIELDIEFKPYDSRDLALPAPFRMDIALTYKCQNKCIHCYNEDRVKEELKTEQWKTALDKMWDYGIPHIVFTGGESTLREDLPELIAKSEDNGQITGLVTNGRKLSKPGYLKELIELGLDHVQITVESHNSATHDKIVSDEGAWEETIAGLKTVIKEDVYVSTNTTIMKDNFEEILYTVKFLHELGVKNIACNSLIRAGAGKNAKTVSFEELKTLLNEVKQFTEANGIDFVWYTPTPYCELNPINLDLGIRNCTACSINLACEPNGDVLPCQSYYKPLGNILKDPWEKIWQAPLCADIRSRAHLPEKCGDCELLGLCGGGCPLSIEAGDYLCTEGFSST